MLKGQLAHERHSELISEIRTSVCHDFITTVVLQPGRRPALGQLLVLPSFSAPVKEDEHPPSAEGEDQTTHRPTVPEFELWRRLCLVNLSCNDLDALSASPFETLVSTYASNVRQSQLDTQRRGPLAIRGTVATQPCNVTTRAQEYGGRDKVSGKILYADRDVPCEQNGITSDSNGSTDKHDSDSFLVAIR
jgi:hypothetical protein